MASQLQVGDHHRAHGRQGSVKLKILLPINQSASIANGHEAPHSTELLEVPIEQLPETLRLVLARDYDPRMHHVVIGGARFDQARDLSLAKPVTIESAVAALITFYRRSLL